MASFLDGHGGYCTCTRDKCTYDCATYRRYKPKPVTNYDRIISKTPEELAAQIVEWIEGIDPISGTLYDNDTDGWIDWLKQEAKDGT